VLKKPQKVNKAILIKSSCMMNTSSKDRHRCLDESTNPESSKAEPGRGEIAKSIIQLILAEWPH
jgi:hypothetical protein